MTCLAIDPHPIVRSDPGPELLFAQIHATMKSIVSSGLLALIVLASPAAAYAQEGSIRYNHSVQYEPESHQGPGAEAGENHQWRGGGGGDAHRPQGGGGGGFHQPLTAGQDATPTGSTGTVVLTFTPGESLMRREVLEDPQPSASGAADHRGFGRWMASLASSRGTSETVVAAYHNNAEGTFTETRDFRGRSFLIRGETPEYEWRLVGEQSQFLGFVVQKATTMLDSKLIEAWFTPEIPVSAGPGPYGGLPGMILVVSVDGGKELYSAKEIDLNALAEGAVKAPDEGQDVSPEAYESLVEEKLAELRAMRR
jgi:GLPGLI family protein